MNGRHAILGFLVGAIAIAVFVALTQGPLASSENDFRPKADETATPDPIVNPTPPPKVEQQVAGLAFTNLADGAVVKDGDQLNGTAPGSTIELRGKSAAAGQVVMQTVPVVNGRWSIKLPVPSQHRGPGSLEITDAAGNSTVVEVRFE